jgi:hypothetical protein
MANKYHRASLIVEAYGKWVERYVDQGFRVYLVTFKFSNITGPDIHKISEMHREIENQFYPTLIKHVERWPLKPSRQQNLPRLISVPDLPVHKNTKKLSARDVTINNGLHVQAIVAMAPTLRSFLNGAKLTKLLREKRHRFIGRFTSGLSEFSSRFANLLISSILFSY